MINNTIIIASYIYCWIYYQSDRANIMKSIFILSLLAALSSVCQAVICEGNAANNCNGMANTCNSEGLCVIHSFFDRCCTISSTSTDGSCISNEDPTMCEGDGMMGITSIIEDTDTQLNVQVTKSPTPNPTQHLIWATSRFCAETSAAACSPSWRDYLRLSLFCPSDRPSQNANSTCIRPIQTLFSTEGHVFLLDSVDGQCESGPVGGR